MSGPKYSQLSIEQQRQRQLELERQRRLEEEKKKRQLQQRIGKEETALRQQTEAIIQSLGRFIQELSANGLEDRLLYSKLTVQKEKTETKVRSFSMSYDTSSIPQMETQLSAIKNFRNQLKKDDETKMKELTEQAEAELRVKKDFEKRQQTLEDLKEAAVSKKKTYAIPVIQKEQEEAKEQEETADIQAEVKKAYEELRPFFQEETAYFAHDVKQLYESICSIADNAAYDNGYKKSQIDLRMKTFLMNKRNYKETLDSLAEQRAEYEELLLHYQSLCEIMDVEEQSLFSAAVLDNTEKLKGEIARLDQQYTEKQEMEYIVQSVHEVMENLGYDILATDYMVRKKQNVHHHIYEFGFEQAVNVFVSDNGSILFEVTGIGDGQSEMSSLEKLKVTEAMDAFCTHYVEIREELKDKGIYLQNESLSPADERYARKIDISNKQLMKQRDQVSKTSSKKKSGNTPRTLE